MNIKILIVEDDEQFSYLLAEQLRDARYEVLHARNGRNAFELVRTKIRQQGGAIASFLRQAPIDIQQERRFERNQLSVHFASERLIWHLVLQNWRVMLGNHSGIGHLNSFNAGFIRHDHGRRHGFGSRFKQPVFQNVGFHRFDPGYRPKLAKVERYVGIRSHRVGGRHDRRPVAVDGITHDVL